MLESNLNIPGHLAGIVAIILMQRSCRVYCVESLSCRVYRVDSTV